MHSNADAWKKRYKETSFSFCVIVTNHKAFSDVFFYCFDGGF